jgi:hypothetical protein
MGWLGVTLLILAATLLFVFNAVSIVAEFVSNFASLLDLIIGGDSLWVCADLQRKESRPKWI